MTDADSLAAAAAAAGVHDIAGIVNDAAVAVRMRLLMLEAMEVGSDLMDGSHWIGHVAAAVDDQ
jgi:hypothetical protein